MLFPYVVGYFDLKEESAARRSSFELPLSARTQTWFSSLSRKDPKKAAIAVTEPTPSSSLPPYSPRVITVNPGLEEPLTKSEPLSIPEHHTQTQQSWLSQSSSSSSGSPPPFASTIPKTPPSIIPSPQGSPTKTANDIAPASPPVSHSPSVNNLRPSLNDSVPSSLSPHKGTSTPKNSPLEPTTPSSSRFTLSIPLLGRPKVPLDSVMGLGESKKTQVPVIALPDSSRDSRQESTTGMFPLPYLYPTNSSLYLSPVILLSTSTAINFSPNTIDNFKSLPRP